VHARLELNSTYQSTASCPSKSPPDASLPPRCQSRNVVLRAYLSSCSVRLRSLLSFSAADSPGSGRPCGMLATSRGGGRRRGREWREGERLNHGWFAVKNRSTKEIQQGVTIDQRHLKEKQFFQTTPWSSLPNDRVGIPSLKNFLGKLLYDHIRSEFPVLVQEIRTLVVESRAQLDSLGPSRQTFMEQRQFLTRLAVRYQRSVTDGLTGNYDNTWESDDARKLRMHLQMTNEAFSKRMAQRGHTRAFRLVDGEVDKDFAPFLRKDEDNIYH